MKIAGKILRKSLKETDFGLDDDFCDAEGLKKSWEETQIPNDWITFYSSIYNLRRLAIQKEKSKSKSSWLDEVYDDDKDDDSDEDYDDDSEDEDGSEEKDVVEVVADEEANLLGDEKNHGCSI